MKQILLFLLILAVISFLQAPNLFASGDDTLVLKSTQIISNDTTIFFEENFNDGNLTNNPEWIISVTQKCAPQPAKVDIIDGALRLYQKNARVCGNAAILTTELNIPVTDSTKIQFDVKPSYSTVDEGAGYSSNEYPISIHLSLTNQQNEFLSIYFSYNYRGGESYYIKNYVRHVFPYCEKDKWIRNEIFRIRDFLPDAKTILELQVVASGWDYTGWVDNIKIFDSGRIAGTEQAEVPPYELPDLDTTSTSRREKAIVFYRKNLRIATVAKNLLHQAIQLRKIGWLYFQMDNYDSAMFYYNKVISVTNKIDVPEKYGYETRAYLEMSKIYTLQNEYDKALSALDIVSNIYQKTNDREGNTTTLNEKAKVYYLKGEINKSIHCYKDVLELNQTPENTTLRARTFQNLGDLNIHISMYQQALENYQKAFEINKKIGDLNSLAMLFFDIGNLYFKMKNYDEAIQYLNKSYKLAKMRNLENLIRDIYLKYSEIYHEKDEKEMALKYFELYSGTQDMLFHKEKNKELADQYAKYHTEKKEQQITLLTKENEIKELKLERKTFQTYLFWSIFFLGLIVILIIYARYRLKQKANLLLAEQKAQLEKFNTELIEKNKLISGQKQEIEKQVNEKETMLRELHHRVKNNLQVIYSMLSLQADKLKDKDAIEAIEANIHRIWAMSLIHHKLYLDENLTQINMPKYVDELGTNILDTNTMIDQQVNLKYDIQNIELEADIAIPLGLIINELLSNALKHAFEGVSVPEVLIELREESNQLILNIKDNGVGIAKEADPNKPGAFGLELINMLVRQLKGTLEVTNKNGTCFKLVLSLSETTHADAIPSQIINQ